LATGTLAAIKFANVFLFLRSITLGYVAETSSEHFILDRSRYLIVGLVIAFSECELIAQL